MHDLNAAVLQEGGRARALCSSTDLHTADTDRTNKCHSASYNCLLTFAGVSPYIAASSRNTLPSAEGVLQQPAPILVGTDLGSGNLESRENLLLTHYWHSSHSFLSPLTTSPSLIICFHKHLARSRPYLDLCKCLSHCYVTAPWCCPRACLTSDFWAGMGVYKSFKWCT